MLPQPAPSRNTRFALWASVLVLASLEDLLLTVVGIKGTNGSELNPIAALALTHGVLTAAALKLASLTAAVTLAVIMSRVGYSRYAERTLGFWSIAYLLLNAYSTYELLGGIS